MGRSLGLVAPHYFVSLQYPPSYDIFLFVLFLNEYPAACCGWDGQETDLRNGAYSMLND
jgi:hypothetical protein